MKNYFLLAFLFILLSCKEESKQPLKYADVDTSSNEALHLTDRDDTYYSFESLIEANKGKVLYVFFFNTVTQVEVMRSIESLEKQLDPEKFTILTIMTDTAMSSFKNHLSITTLKHNYLVRNFPDSKFFTKYNFISIPRSMIFDVNGKAIDENAMLPDDINLKPTLENLISQN